MKPDQEKLKNLLKESITVLCKNGLNYANELCVEGLLGITLDNREVFLVNINQKLKSDLPESTNDSAESASSQTKERRNSESSGGSRPSSRTSTGSGGGSGGVRSGPSSQISIQSVTGNYAGHLNKRTSSGTVDLTSQSPHKRLRPGEGQYYHDRRNERMYMSPGDRRTNVTPTSSPQQYGRAQMFQRTRSPQTERTLGSPQLRNIGSSPQMRSVAGSPQMRTVAGSPQTNFRGTAPPHKSGSVQQNKSQVITVRGDDDDDLHIVEEDSVVVSRSGSSVTSPPVNSSTSRTVSQIQNRSQPTQGAHRSLVFPVSNPLPGPGPSAGGAQQTANPMGRGAADSQNLSHLPKEIQPTTLGEVQTMQRTPFLDEDGEFQGNTTELVAQLRSEFVKYNVQNQDFARHVLHKSPACMTELMKMGERGISPRRSGKAKFEAIQAWLQKPEQHRIRAYANWKVIRRDMLTKQKFDRDSLGEIIALPSYRERVPGEVMTHTVQRVPLSSGTSEAGSMQEKPAISGAVPDPNDDNVLVITSSDLEDEGESTESLTVSLKKTEETWSVANGQKSSPADEDEVVEEFASEVPSDQDGMKIKKENPEEEQKIKEEVKEESGEDDKAGGMKTEDLKQDVSDTNVEVTEKEDLKQNKSESDKVEAVEGEDLKEGVSDKAEEANMEDWKEDESTKTEESATGEERDMTEGEKETNSDEKERENEEEKIKEEVESGDDSNLQDEFEDESKDQNMSDDDKTEQTETEDENTEHNETEDDKTEQNESEDETKDEHTESGDDKAKGETNDQDNLEEQDFSSESEEYNQGSTSPMHDSDLDPEWEEGSATKKSKSSEQETTRRRQSARLSQRTSFK